MDRRHLKPLRKKFTSRVAPLRRLLARATTLRTATLALVLSTTVLPSCLVPQCSHPPIWPCHQRRLVNCDRMPASYTSGHPSFPHRHPTCWASSQRGHTISSTLCHGAWTSAPLSAHVSTEWECKVSKIDIPICTHRTTTRQSNWQQQKCGTRGESPMECRVVGQHHETPHFHPRQWHPLEWSCQGQRGSSLTATALVSDVPVPACTNGIWPLLQPVSVAQNKPSTCRTAVSNPSIFRRPGHIVLKYPILPMDCTA